MATSLMLAHALTKNRSNHKAFLFLLSILSTSPAWAGVETTSRVQQYEVTGTTAKEVRASINKERVKFKMGQHDGITQYNINWKYKYTQDGDKCRMTDLDVKCEIVIHMPRWTGHSQVDSELKSQWDKYYDGLMLHEQGHADRAIAAAHQVEKVILEATASNCRLLPNVAKIAGQKVLTQLSRDQQEYDRVTKHGQAQGANFG